MRIFLATHESGNIATPSRAWYHNLYLPLKDLFNEVVYYVVEDPSSDEALKGEENGNIKERNLQRAIESAHNKKNIDIFFSYFSSEQISASLIHHIRNLGILTVNWYCNASYQFDLVREIAPHFDYCLVPELFRIEDYRKIGANPIYCQEAANPNIYRNLSLPIQMPASFVGARYGSRKAFFMRLAQYKLPVHLFGPGWQETEQHNALYLLYLKLFRGMTPLADEYCNAPVSDAVMIEIFNTSAINFGLTICGDTYTEVQPIVQVRLRDFEVPMCGGFYLTEFNEELTGFFEPDKEIIMFKTAEEAADKGKYYLNNEKLRVKIAAAGHARAINEHTSHKRWRAAFLEMGVQTDN